MLVKDFLALEKSGCYFRVIDAGRTGYMTKPFVLLADADRNVVKSAYGTWQLVGFEPISKKVIAIYVKGETA